MHYVIYFAGPFLLGIAGARVLGQRYGVFVIGMIAFLVTWVINETIASVSLSALHLTERSFLYGAIIALSAGVFEESARHVVFRRVAAFRDNRSWRSSLTYALGHHGMETIIVGLTLVLITLVVTYKPDAISDPTRLKECEAAIALGSGTKLYQSLERLSVGLLIHACFSGVVMLGLVRGRRRWLFVAMAWHFAHDLISFNLGRISPHWIVGRTWIVIIVVLYSYLAVRNYRAFQPTAAAPVTSTAGTPPMILPGRPA